MGISKNIMQLCNPALFYLIVSSIALLVTLFQNLGNNGIYTLGRMSYRVPSTIIIFLIKIVYVIFWTWILNLICKDGYTSISWLLVFFPFIIIAIMIIILMMYSNGHKRKQKNQNRRYNHRSPYYIK